MPTTFDYCLRHGILGVGWRTDSQTITKNWDEYYNEASSIHDNLDICKYINKWVSEGDLVWTRDLDGHYCLARVKSGWEYWTCEEAIKNDIDVANVFRCEIRRVDIDEVPGKVVACHPEQFRKSQIQRQESILRICGTNFPEKMCMKLISHSTLTFL